jgi:hypothetical protein
MTLHGYWPTPKSTPDAFIGQAEDGSPALFGASEDALAEPVTIGAEAEAEQRSQPTDEPWVGPLAAGEVVQFEGHRYFGSDILNVRPDGTWSTTHRQPEAATWVEHNEICGAGSTADLAEKLLGGYGPGAYQIHYAEQTIAYFAFRDGHFEEVDEAAWIAQLGKAGERADVDGR